MKRKRKQLRKQQQDVLDDLFDGGLDESAVLKKHGVSRHVYDKWLADEVFGGEFNSRLWSARRQAEVIIARYASVAAAKLVALTESEKEETARRACLDIISLPVIREKVAGQHEDNGDDEEVRRELSGQQVSRILEILADERA